MRWRCDRVQQLATPVLASVLILVGLTNAEAGRVALIHTTIINPANSAVIEDGSLVIEDDHIAAPGEIKLPPAVREIDCTGKFVLPGYIHLSP